MGSHASAKKAHKQNLKRAKLNKSRISKIKTLIKKVLFSIKSNNKEEAKKFLSKVQSEAVRAIKKNIIKKNTASRKISRLAYRIKTMTKRITKN